MNPTVPYWCVATVESLPEVLSDDGVLLAEGLPESQDPNEDDLHFMLLCRTTASGESQAHEQIRDCLAELGVRDVSDVSTLTTDVETVSMSERTLSERLQPGEVSLRSTFIGFGANCPAAREQARRSFQDWIQDKPCDSAKA